MLVNRSETITSATWTIRKTATRMRPRVHEKSARGPDDQGQRAQQCRLCKAPWRRAGTFAFLESDYRLVRIDEKAMNQFHREQSVNVRSVISALVKVAANDFLDSAAIQHGRESVRSSRSI